MHSPIPPTAKILIVDDEPSNVRLLERMLDLLGGIEYRATTNPSEAISLFVEFEPDLVLTDLHMPRVDGYALMSQMRQIIPEETVLPIVVLTADITPETRRRALAAGADEFITKPLDTSEVQLRIRHLLENRFLHQRMDERVKQRTMELEDALKRLQAAQDKVVHQERLRALGMMAGGVAHDFNNSLTMMLGYSELLVPWFESRAKGTKEQAYLSQIVAAAHDATHVVSRLREFFRPAEAGEIRTPICIGTLCEQAAALTAPRWRRGSANGVPISLTTDVEPMPKILGCAPELREVLTNLIFNAVDAMPDGGAILIRARHSEGKVQVDVMDSGIGMDAQQQARCLDPFFTTKGEHGTGLGLSVSYGIIQRHNGEISIKSAPGEGTTFSILLPASEDPIVEMAATPAEQVERALRVCVVDDQKIICELVSEYLRNDGHEVQSYFSANTALEKFGTGESLDLVITDQSMPEMMGVQLAQKMKQRRKDIPIILVTGFGDEMIAENTLPQGIDLILSKPLSAAGLRRAIFTVTQ